MPLPNFVVPGVAKAGTTSLWYYFSQHPEVFVTTPKEPNFFVAEAMSPGRAVSSEAEYRKLYKPGRGSAARGDISPAYLTHWRLAVPRIKQMIPNCRVIILLRNPIDRTYSRYWAHFVRDDAEKRPFREIVTEIRHAEGVKGFLEGFGEERILICLADEMQSKRQEFLRRIWIYLGLENTEIEVAERALNRSGPVRFRWIEWCLQSLGRLPGPIKNQLRRLPRRIRNDAFNRVRSMNLGAKPPMDQDIRQELEKYFRDEIAELERISGLDLAGEWLR